jgi:hypothetical protein
LGDYVKYNPHAAQFFIDFYSFLLLLLVRFAPYQLLMLAKGSSRKALSNGKNTGQEITYLC